MKAPRYYFIGIALCLASTLVWANVVFDALTPQLVVLPGPSLQQRSAGALVFTTLSLSDNSNENLGTALPSFTHPTFNVEVSTPNALRRTQGPSRALSVGSYWQGEALRLDAVMNQRDASSTGHSYSVAAAVSSQVDVGRVILRPALGLYTAVAANNQQTDAALFGGEAVWHSGGGVSLGLDAYGTHIESDETLALDGGRSLDVRIRAQGQITPKLSVTAGAIHQDYQVDSAVATFDAAGVWLGASMNLGAWRWLTYSERKRLDFEAVNPLTGQSQDRTRQRLGLRAQRPTKIGLLAVEGMSDQFSSQDSLKPANRVQWRLSLTIPFIVQN